MGSNLPCGINNKVSTRSDVVYLKDYSDRLLSVLKNIIEDKVEQLDQIEAVKLFNEKRR
ncbi:MAG: hypothetical protein BWY74_04318 [Firmicutes bacterium ADurb.Bin419]|nr:MAG: hypothetical protein BWY74_04318 [Firmicutes bacterium ADurb.Bin419]